MARVSEREIHRRISTCADTHTHNAVYVIHTIARLVSLKKQGGQNIKKGMRNKAGKTNGVNSVT